MKQQLHDKSNDRYTNIKNVVYKDYQWESNDKRENKKIRKKLKEESSSSSSEKEESRSSNSDSEKKLNHKNKINFWIKKQNQLIWK